jgi:cytochrome c oxidase subunit I
MGLRGSNPPFRTKDLKPGRRRPNREVSSTYLAVTPARIVKEKNVGCRDGSLFSFLVADFAIRMTRGILKVSMVAHKNSEGSAATHGGGFWGRHLFTTDHKAVGLQYLWLALFSVFVGMSLSVLMRIHLTQTGTHLSFFSGTEHSPERYAALTLLHGSLMVFFVLTAAPQFGFGYFFLPLQIGAREMAFPLLSAFSVWLTFLSLAGMTGSFFLRMDTGMALWACSAACFCFGALLSAVNFCATAIDMRTRGMTLSRLPLTAWSWLVTAILSLLIFSILLAACVLLLSDQFARTQFFGASSAAESALPVLWQRWFWFFAQAQVYVAMLPCFGIVSHLLSIFSRKPVWAERLAVLALCGVGLSGFCIWGYHMFASGLNPYSPLVFSLLASSLGVPAAFLIASWLGTLWDAKVQLTTAMLFALGFFSLFLSGGFTGLMLSQRTLEHAAITDDFVTGHFHLVMGVATTFAILGGLFFWFPKMFGRRMNETLGKIHFWITLAGVYCVFMPMHWLGFLDQTRDAAGLTIAGASRRADELRALIAIAAVMTIAAQIIFLANFVWSLLRGEKAARKNPWRATTLEWFVPSPPPKENFGETEPVVYRGAYELGVPFAGTDFVPQHLAPEVLTRYR